MKFDYWANPYKWKGIDKVTDLLSLYEQRRFLYQDIYIEHRIKELLEEGHRKEEIFIKAEQKPILDGYNWSVVSGWPRKDRLPYDGEDWEE